MTNMTDYEKFIALSRYARWLPEEGRRENWGETVDRYMDNIVGDKVSHVTASELREAIYNRDVMPSMRSLMSAGEAFNRNNIAGFNCSYLAVNSVEAFEEAVLVLMCGTGLGFTVERQDIAKLPEVPDLSTSSATIVVEDSKEGWAESVGCLVSLLYQGQVPTWDVSKLRPAGARLKTFGGRSSGPAPLVKLMTFILDKFLGAQGRKITSLECHDILCMIGDIVVVGGVRRSALISLSNLSDIRMRNAKASNGWYKTEGQRSLANNSVAYTEKPEMAAFMEEWSSLMRSGSGERGIFNRCAAVKQVERTNRRNPLYAFGVNPCGEIILRPMQFCNLSEAVVRKGDTIESLSYKVHLAAILGTIQASYSYFPGLREDWVKNHEEERLLGVSLTGIMDNPLTNLSNAGLANTLAHLKSVAVEANKHYAAALGINQAAAVTCVKPSGTVSQLVNSSSGIHPRFSEQYIRTVRGDMNDPMTKFLADQGVPVEPAEGKEGHTAVFSFPVKSPEGSITTEQVTALEQLELWMMYKQHWCEHNPSCTIHVKKDEWLKVGAWVYENFDEVSGIAFLPYDGHIYPQAPYQPLTKGEYEDFLKKMPLAIDWGALMEYEDTDNTHGSQTLACTGDVCEIVDIS